MRVRRRTGRPRGAMRVVMTLLLVLAFMPASTGLATIVATEYYVDMGSGSDITGDGSAGNPWKSITKAMAESNSGDTVWVAGGTYDTAVEPNFPILVKSGVAVRALAGTGDVNVDAEGTDGVFEIANATAGTILEGLTITGGGTVAGSGIKITRNDTGPIPIGWPKILDCFIYGNDRFGERGGGISVFGSADATCAPLIQDTVVSFNEANYGGGLAFRGQTAPVVDDCFVYSNTSVYAGGGAYLADSFDAQFLDVNFASNVATDAGGALSTASDGLYSDLLVSDCTVRDNTAHSMSGGFYVDNATVHVEATTFTGNVGDEDGGALYFNGSHAYVTDCAIYDNYSGDDGGPMALNSGSVTTVTQCTIFDNDGADNAGIYNNGTTLGIFNSIVGGHGGDDLIGAAVVADSCFEEVGVTGTGVIHDDPLMLDPFGGDFRVELGSPVIDTGGLVETDTDDLNGDLRPIDGDGNGSALPDMGCYERPALEIERYAGTNRYDTACQMAESAFDSARTAVLASGENFPDALSAAGLAGAYGGPLLLTRSASVPSQVQTTLSNLGVSDVVIVGGESAVSADVYDWLENTGGYNVSRVWGSTRYETSAEVALEVASISGLGRIALFARGDAFPDALAAAPLAYHEAIPVMLVKPTSVPQVILDAMDSMDLQGGYVLGGVSAVSGPTKTAIDAQILDNEGSATERWAGNDRYDTAAVVAENGAAENMTSTGYVGVATGTNFPDALAGGVTAGQNDGVLLLTKPTSLPSYTYDFLDTYGSVVFYAEVYGGTVAISQDVEDAVFDALGWPAP